MRQHSFNSFLLLATGPPLPPGFSAPSASSSIGPSAASSKTKRQPSQDVGDSDSDSDNDDGSDDDGQEDQSLHGRIPASHEIVLNHGVKTVSAMSLDPSGSRLVTGGVDYDMKMWDFAAMDASLHSFRSLQPCESHQIKTLQYSITGDCILVAAAKAQA